MHPDIFNLIDVRNESSKQLVRQVEERQKQPFLWNIQIDGLDIDLTVKQLIFNHHSKHLPFGLATEDHRNVVYFFPSHGCAVWCDGGNVTLNTFQDDRQFEDCIKMALVAHRTFLGGRQISGHERHREICEQLKQLS